MRKVLLCCVCAVLALQARAQVITLDLTQPTNPATITYDANDLWTGTKDATAQYATIDFQVFKFSHYGYNSYWNGFTISKEEVDTVCAGYDHSSCMGKGGIAGVGTPFIWAYYSSYGVKPTNTVTFANDSAYTPMEVYLCQSAVAYNDIVNGGLFGRKFHRNDYFKVTIYALNDTLGIDSTRFVDYYLADYRATDSLTWTVNRAWERVDLSPLGRTKGLCFTMTSTDVGAYGSNTATYFALDGLKVQGSATTGINIAHEVNEQPALWQIFTVTGQHLGSAYGLYRDVQRDLPKGFYILRSNNRVEKFVK